MLTRKNLSLKHIAMFLAVVVILAVPGLSAAEETHTSWSKSETKIKVDVKPEAVLNLFLKEAQQKPTPKSTPHSTIKTIDWKIENFGVLQVPANWKVVKLEEVIDRLDKIMSQTDKNSTVDIADKNLKKTNSLTKEDIEAFFKKENLHIYQATMNHDEHYHTAWFLLLKETEALTPQELPYFSANTSNEARQKYSGQFRADIENNLMSINDSAPEASDPNVGQTVKVLGEMQVKSLNVKDKPAYKAEFGVLIEALGLMFPYYAQVYTFNLDGYAAHALLITNYSDSDFWSPVFSSAVESIK